MTLLVCCLLGFADAARLAGVAVAIVMLVPSTDPAWTVALHRFLETAIGIVIAVMISKTPRQLKFL